METNNSNTDTKGFFDEINKMAEKAGIPKIGTKEFNDLSAQMFGGSKPIKYYLVDPNDETGNDDGILDTLEMTKEEATQRNNNNRENNIDRRWIPARKERSN